jgi:hypothetical protein
MQVRHLMGSHTPPQSNAPMGRADRVLVKTGAAHRFLVSESLTLPRPGGGAGCLAGHQDIKSTTTGQLLLQIKRIIYIDQGYGKLSGTAHDFSVYNDNFTAISI